MKKFLFFSLFTFATAFSFAQIRLNKINPPSAPPSSGSCCGFSATNTTALPMAAKFSKENIIAFDQENFDDGNAYDGAFYTAPSNGVYQFNIVIALKVKNTSTGIEQVMLILKAGNAQTSQLINITGGYDNAITGTATGIFKLKSGEKASVVLIGLGSNTTAVTMGNGSIFNGVKLY